MAKILILGGSFSGLTAAFQLRRHLGKKAEVTVISNLDNFIFIPSLPWVAMGWQKPGNITIPLGKILIPKGIGFIHNKATGVDADASKVITGSGDLEYDYLIIATGPHLAFSAVPGLGPEEGHTECIFTMEQALRCRSRWEGFLEEPGPVIVGAVQGVSCFGPAYEYLFEVDSELRKKGLRHKAPITFVTSEPYPGHFGFGGLGNSRRMMEEECARREITVISNTAVDEFVPGEARLGNGLKLPFKLSMFAPPMTGVKAVHHLGNPKGFIPIDNKYRHTEHRNIFAAGVAVAIAPPEETLIPVGVPKTGYMAVKMAKNASRTIAAEVLGRDISDPEPLDAICLMDMGDKAAFMKANPVLPPRQEAVLKAGIRYRWMKKGYEKYFLWKMKHGLT